MKCPKCGAAMKPLLVSWFCPNDCDKKKAVEVETPRVSASSAWCIRPESLAQIGAPLDLDSVLLWATEAEAQAFWDNFAGPMATLPCKLVRVCGVDITVLGSPPGRLAIKAPGARLGSMGLQGIVDKTVNL